MTTEPKKRRKGSPYSRPRENIPPCGLCQQRPESKPGEPCKQCLSRYGDMLTPRKR